jgi:hypothetical protein
MSSKKSKYEEVHDSPEKYPKRNKDGKVLNPSTENWVQPNYAQGRGFLEEAERLTQQRLYDRDHPEPEETQDSVPETTGSLEDVGENFENAGIESEEEFDMEPEYIDEDDPLNQLLDDADQERETGKASFEDENLVSEEEFMNQFQEGGGSGQQAQGPGQKSSAGDHKGFYTTKGGGTSSQGARVEDVSEDSSGEEDDGPKYRYERTDTGGMRKVRIDKDE